MPKPSHRYGMIVLRQNQPTRRSDLQELVINSRIGTHALDLVMRLRRKLINCHKLLMKVIKRRTRRLKPVLEGHHVLHGRIQVVQVPHRPHSHRHVLEVFLGGQCPSRRQLGRILRPVNIVPTTNNQIMPARKETIRLAEFLGIRQFLKLLGAPARGHEACAYHVHDVVVPLRRGKVLRHPAPLGLGRNMAVIEVPIVIRNDLKKVGNSPEFRHCTPKFLSAEAVESFPFPCICADHAGFLGRSLKIARRAECAVMPIGIMVNQGWRGTGTS